MIIIYYRNAAGKICDGTKPPAGCTLGQLRQHIETTSALHGGGCRAYMKLVPENGLTAFLLERAGA